MVGKKILVLGDSITNFGQYVSVMEYYFTRFLPGDRPEFINLGVSSETASGLSEAQHPFLRPCVLNRVSRALRSIKPDEVITCYGINDGIYQPFSDRNLKAFQEGYLRLLEEIKSFGAKTVVLTPPAFDSVSFEDTLLDNALDEEYSYMHPYTQYDSVMERYAGYVMTELSVIADKVIDIYHPLKDDIAKYREADPSYLHGDGIHPGLAGHITIARAILFALYGRQLPNLEQWVEKEQELFEFIHERGQLIHNYETERIGHDNPNKLEACPQMLYAQFLKDSEEKIADYLCEQKEQPVIRENWNGFSKHIIMFEGYEATIVEPKKRRADGAFVWRTEFFDAFAYVDLEMVKRGYLLVHLNLANQYGAQEATAVMGRFGTFLTREYGCDSRSVLFGFSRGGLYAVSYALAWPERTSVLYLDAPVVDLSSWPGGALAGTGSEPDWAECKDIYKIDRSMKNEDAIMQMRALANERVLRLSETKIPLVIVAGDCDEVVPYKENGARLADAYRNKGGAVLEIIKPGVGHHPHSLTEPAPVADFIDLHRKDTALL